MNRNKVKYICFGLLAILIIFHFVNNLYFLSKNPLAEGKDSYAHITAFSNFKQILENNQNNPFFRSEKSLVYNLVFVVIDYPPLFYLSVYLINLLLGSFLLNAALMTNTFYMIILLLSVYAIADRIDPIAAIISTFICSMYPLVFISSRHFSLELSLAAISALSVLLLIKTEYFEDRKSSLILGIFLGIGMLTKQTFLIYIGGPLIFYIWTSLTREQTVLAQNKKKVNLVLCLIIVTLISLIFYYNKEVYLNILNRAGFIGAVNSNDLFSLEQLTYYLRTLPNTIGYFFLLILIWALFYLRKIEGITKALLILWMIVPLVFFTFIKLKYAEYTIAFLPPLSLISGFAISGINKKTLRVLIITAIITMGIFNYYSISLGESKNFYATYYLSEPEMKVVYPENKLKSAEQVLESIAFSKAKIGVFYDSDSNALVFPSYFIRLVGLNPRKKAQIVDFSFCPDVFFHALNDFDIMIFVTCSEKSWITEQSFNQFIKQMNDKNLDKLKFSRSYIRSLVDLYDNIEKINEIIFDKQNEQEKVYIYKRNK